MKPVIGMVVFSIGSWLATVIFVDRQTALEILCGMLGPLFAVSVTAIIVDKTYRQHSEALTAIMIAAFGGKLVYFLAYVTIMLRVLSLRPKPFVASFTMYFIALYFIEALRLRRLFWGGMRA